MRARTGLSLALAVLTSACVLTAEHPMFSAADADPAFAPREGLWVIADADCKADPARAKPGDTTCLDWVSIKRAPDGRWILSDGAEPADVSLGVFVAMSDAAQAGLRVAEIIGADDKSPSYAVAWPLAQANGRITRLRYRAISCADLADPPLADITVTRSEDGAISGCIAQTREGVLGAARRAEVAPPDDDAEMVFVRP